MPLTDVKAGVIEAEQVLEPKLAADAATLEKAATEDLKAVVDHFLAGLREFADGTTVTITINHKEKIS